MDIEEIKGKVNPYLELIVRSTKTVEDAENASNDFLLIRSYLADNLQLSEALEGVAKAEKESSWSKAFASIEGSAANKEQMAKGNEAYLEAVRDLARQESITSWLKVHLDIFSDATVGFRQKAGRLGGTR